MLRERNLNGFKYMGFQQIRLSANNVAAGNHTLVVGGYVTRKTSHDEFTYVRFDEVQVYATN